MKFDLFLHYVSKVIDKKKNSERNNVTPGPVPATLPRWSDPQRPVVACSWFQKNYVIHKKKIIQLTWRIKFNLS